jgi:RpiR family carbohydrate utilization transcriptional regulator
MRTKTATSTKTASTREQTWRDRITGAFERMSASNRKVATFLLEQTTEAAFMTGSQLANHLDLDPATIVRFAQALGYPGYPELSSEIQATVRQIFEVAHEVKEPSAGTPSANWQGGLLSSAAAIENIAGVIVWRDARKFLTTLRSAQTVLVVAEGADAVLGQWLTQVLRSAGLRAISVDADPTLSTAVVQTTRAGDVLVGVAVTAAGENVAEALRAATARGARALALTTGASMPAGLASEVTLTCPAPEGSLATVSFAAIVESLRRALAANG